MYEYMPGVEKCFQEWCENHPKNNDLSKYLGFINWVSTTYKLEVQRLLSGRWHVSSFEDEELYIMFKLEFS